MFLTDSGKTVTLLDEVTTALDEIVKKDGQIEVPLVVALDDTHFQIAGVEYALVKDYRTAFNIEAVANRYHDVLDKYDYIVGDWGYEQLRLKGFYKNTNRKVPLEKRIHTLEDYLYEYCNFGCAYFVLQRISAPTVQQAKLPKENRRSRKNRRNKASKADNERKTFHKATNVSVQSATPPKKSTAVKATYQVKDSPNKRNKAVNPTKMQRNFAVKEVKANKEAQEVSAVRRKTIPKSSKRRFEIREHGKSTKE